MLGLITTLLTIRRGDPCGLPFAALRQNDSREGCHYNVKERLSFAERLDLSARFQYIICRVRACPYRRLGIKRCGFILGKGKPLPYNIMCHCINYHLP